MDEPMVPEFLQEQVHLEQLKSLVLSGGSSSYTIWRGFAKEWVRETLLKMRYRVF